ncbi:MAG: bifunctional DNA-binding transcriptional regulator/O6-methylguanine-DNA methyltransferase Ada [Anaerolineae bacterium]|jgi:AraC family transcriptional regulator of adaptative response/methylated-DNA-[protein]-cysteine methyltransferase|nr:bifunctional DNA-binding transcriptional regulator/O6-methylguanine-DNA methyltransferase Ada [Anaerolineae bacterium]
MTPLPDAATCWQAVAQRDTTYAGVFVFGVKTTRIYCRPGCPARLPLAHNVAFFALPAAAEQAGYRACRRCQPQHTPLRDEHAGRVQQVCAYIHAHLADALTLEDLGAVVALSPAHLQRQFTRLMGISPHQYVEACRMQQFKAQLKEGERVTTAIYSAGFGSGSRLYERTETHLGMSPTTYQKGGAQMTIAYHTAHSVMGHLLIATTERGICALMIGEDTAELVARLHREFPAAAVRADAGALQEALAQVLAYLAGWQPHLALPLDIRVTAFQQRVLEALLRIPYGATRTYGQIAAALGRPKAARAVGRACATNPVPLIIPCHRVVGSDGSLTGYAYGTERKQYLLALEQQPAGSPVAVPDQG